MTTLAGYVTKEEMNELKKVPHIEFISKAICLDDNKPPGFFVEVFYPYTLLELLLR